MNRPATIIGAHRLTRRLEKQAPGERYADIQGNRLTRFADNFLVKRQFGLKPFFLDFYDHLRTRFQITKERPLSRSEMVYNVPQPIVPDVNVKVGSWFLPMILAGLASQIPARASTPPQVFLNRIYQTIDARSITIDVQPGVVGPPGVRTIGRYGVERLNTAVGSSLAREWERFFTAENAKNAEVRRESRFLDRASVLRHSSASSFVGLGRRDFNHRVGDAPRRTKWPGNKSQAQERRLSAIELGFVAEEILPQIAQICADLSDLRLIPFISAASWDLSFRGQKEGNERFFSTHLPGNDRVFRSFDRPGRVLGSGMLGTPLGSLDRAEIGRFYSSRLLSRDRVLRSSDRLGRILGERVFGTSFSSMNREEIRRFYSSHLPARDRVLRSSGWFGRIWEERAQRTQRGPDRANTPDLFWFSRVVGGENFGFGTGWSRNHLESLYIGGTNQSWKQSLFSSLHIGNDDRWAGSWLLGNPSVTSLPYSFLNLTLPMPLVRSKNYLESLHIGGTNQSWNRSLFSNLLISRLHHHRTGSWLLSNPSVFSVAFPFLNHAISAAPSRSLERFFHHVDHRQHGEEFWARLTSEYLFAGGPVFNSSGLLERFWEERAQRTRRGPAGAIAFVFPKFLQMHGGDHSWAGTNWDQKYLENNYHIGGMDRRRQQNLLANLHLDRFNHRTESQLLSNLSMFLVFSLVKSSLNRATSLHRPGTAFPYGFPSAFSAVKNLLSHSRYHPYALAKTWNTDDLRTLSSTIQTMNSQVPSTDRSEPHQQTENHTDFTTAVADLHRWGIRTRVERFTTLFPIFRDLHDQWFEGLRPGTLQHRTNQNGPITRTHRTTENRQETRARSHAWERNDHLTNLTDLRRWGGDLFLAELLDIKPRLERMFTAENTKNAEEREHAGEYDRAHPFPISHISIGPEINKFSHGWEPGNFYKTASSTFPVVKDLYSQWWPIYAALSTSRAWSAPARYQTPQFSNWFEKIREERTRRTRRVPEAAGTTLLTKRFSGSRQLKEKSKQERTQIKNLYIDRKDPRTRPWLLETPSVSSLPLFFLNQSIPIHITRTGKEPNQNLSPRFSSASSAVKNSYSHWQPTYARSTASSIVIQQTIPSPLSSSSSPRPLCPLWQKNLLQANHTNIQTSFATWKARNHYETLSRRQIQLSLKTDSGATYGKQAIIQKAVPDRMGRTQQPPPTPAIAQTQEPAPTPQSVFPSEPTGKEREGLLKMIRKEISDHAAAQNPLDQLDSQDMAQLCDAVYRHLQRRLTREKERRGI
ncbi:MAG: hypothetical protein QNK37_01650 [Acidobacteriota bacterium]|nr:hypothetical protein [Acidobacteriota bacterium]